MRADAGDDVPLDAAIDLGPLALSARSRSASPRSCLENLTPMPPPHLDSAVLLLDYRRGARFLTAAGGFLSISAARAPGARAGRAAWHGRARACLAVPVLARARSSHACQLARVARDGGPEGRCGRRRRGARRAARAPSATRASADHGSQATAVRASLSAAAQWCVGRRPLAGGSRRRSRAARRARSTASERDRDEEAGAHAAAAEIDRATAPSARSSACPTAHVSAVSVTAVICQSQSAPACSR